MFSVAAVFPCASRRLHASETICSTLTPATPTVKGAWVPAATSPGALMIEAEIAMAAGWTITSAMAEATSTSLTSSANLAFMSRGWATCSRGNVNVNLPRNEPSACGSRAVIDRAEDEMSAPVVRSVKTAWSEPPVSEGRPWIEMPISKGCPAVARTGSGLVMVNATAVTGVTVKVRTLVADCVPC